jgi:hypothetical protein
MQLLGYKCHAMVAAATTQRELPRELPRRHGGMGMEAFRPRLPGAAKRADEQGAALLQLVASTPVEVCCVCDRGANCRMVIIRLIIIRVIHSFIINQIEFQYSSVVGSENTTRF